MWRINYYCKSGKTLVHDTQKGWVCTFGATKKEKEVLVGCEPCAGGWYSGKGYAGAGTYCNVYDTVPYYDCSPGKKYSGEGSSTLCYTAALKE